MSNDLPTITPRNSRQTEIVIWGFRWLALLQVLVIANGAGLPPQNLLLFNLLAATAAAYQLLIWGFLGHRWHPAIPYATSFLDVLYACLGAALTGGLDSDIRFLIFLSPITVALRFNLPLTFLYTTLDGIGCWWLTMPGGLAPEEARDLGVFLSYLFFVALSVGVLSRRVIASRDELEAMVRDRTRELAEANAHLRELDQLKSDFVNAVTHELRTPLTSIRGYAEFLEDEIGGPLTPDQGAFVAQIHEGSWRLQRLVDDLLDFARLEAGTFMLSPEDADLSAKAREVLASLRPQAAAKRIRLELEAPASLAIRMDAGRIAQVLINLVGNALKFTPPEAKVTVRITDGPEGVKVEICDTGEGIAPEHQARLFEKFYQVDPGLTRENGGAGLGLSISKALVEAHGGVLGLTSAVGRGSTFWFTLPRQNVKGPAMQGLGMSD
jgi:signal transduction histidine kinase